MRICPDCLSIYKASTKGKRARKSGGEWGSGKWPASIYHGSVTRKCDRHHAEALANGAARRAGIESATPSWADRAAIRKVFADCISRSRETGVKHEVDHVVPLRGKLVKGLHIHTNLRIITAIENRAKSNHFP